MSRRVRTRVATAAELTPVVATLGVMLGALLVAMLIGMLWGSPSLAQTGVPSLPDTTQDAELKDVLVVNVDPVEPTHAPRSLSPFGDLRLRGDFVTGLPAGRDDLRRGRATLRAGLRWWSPANTSLDLSFRASLATDHNADRRRNFDNERPDAFEPDRAALRWTPWPSWTLAAGKLDLPLRLTALTWDDDLRPIGLTVAGRWSLGTFDALRLAAGGVTGDRYAGDDSRLFAGQLAWLLRDGASAGGELAVALLEFDDLRDDPAEQLQRQNAVVIEPGGARRLVSEFGLIDVQAAVRAPVLTHPATLRVDLVRNHRVDVQRDGIRARLAWGEARGLGAPELGYVFQRIEREAVPGSFNSDDWWFHSADRGHSAWIAIGLGESAFVRVTGFDERRDDLSEHTRRLLIELTARLEPN